MVQRQAARRGHVLRQRRLRGAGGHLAGREDRREESGGERHRTGDLLFLPPIPVHWRRSVFRRGRHDAQPLRPPHTPPHRQSGVSARHAHGVSSSASSHQHRDRRRLLHAIAPAAGGRLPLRVRRHRLHLPPPARYWQDLVPLLPASHRPAALPPALLRGTPRGREEGHGGGPGHGDLQRRASCSGAAEKRLRRLFVRAAQRQVPEDVSRGRWEFQQGDATGSSSAATRDALAGRGGVSGSFKPSDRQPLELSDHCTCRRSFPPRTRCLDARRAAALAPHRQVLLLHDQRSPVFWYSANRPDYV